MLVEAAFATAAGIWLLGCDAADTVEVWANAHGTVYLCDTGQGCIGGTDEYCWDGSERELERLLGADCRETDRLWPALVGCAYCCGAGCPPGSNAHCGSFCEAP